MNRSPDLPNVEIAQADRLPSSNNGNPRFRLVFVRGGAYVATHTTQSDAACNYEVSNFLNAHATVDVWLTRRGMVEYMREVR